MKHRDFQLHELFQLTPGKFHATSELEPGPVPLISCGWENNGVIGHYDIPDEHRHSRVLTVAFNGAPLTTHFHPYEFGAKDDVAVLLPIGPMAESVLIYIAALLNGKTWRYSYGRKCYREKLRSVVVKLPVTDGGSIDSTLSDELLSVAHQQVRAAAVASADALLSTH